MTALPVPRTDEANPEPHAALHACDTCGALLLDPAVHSAWHRDELARVRAGLLRAKRAGASIPHVTFTVQEDR